LSDYASSMIDAKFAESVNTAIDATVDEKDEDQKEYILNENMNEYCSAQLRVKPLQAVDKKLAARVIAKYYYAGASARWMFLRPTKLIKELILDAVRSCSNVVHVANLEVPDQAENVHVNHLVVKRLKRLTFVSLWAARVLATETQVRLSLLDRIQTAMTDNNAVAGWMFQTEFICQVAARAKMSAGDKWITLKRNKVKCARKEHESLNVSKYSRFQSESDILSTDIVGGAWLVPADLHHAAYDVAWIREEKQTPTATGAPNTTLEVVFIQLTVGKRHSLNEMHLLPMLQHLASTRQGRIVKFQVYFVLKEPDTQFRVQYVEVDRLASARKAPEIRVCVSK